LGKLFNQAGQQATKIYQSRQDRDLYEDDYSAPRPKPSPKQKRRPRTKSRPPQDFNFGSNYESEYDRSYTDPYAEPLDSPRSVYKGDINDGVNNFDDWNNDDDYGDHTDSYQEPYQDEPPIKRSARRPRRQ
jgi:hypothetical protein